MKTALKLFLVIGVLVLLGATAFMMTTPKIAKITQESKDDTGLPVLIPVNTPPSPLPDKENFILGDEVQTLHLRIGERFEIPTGYIVIADVLSDSRCPLGVECFWVGQVRVGLRYTNKLTSESYDAEIALPSQYKSVIDGYHITLISVKPEKTTTAINKKSYRFDITVAKEGGSIVSVDNAPSSDLGELTGTVLVGPMCPVIKEGEDCPDKELPGATLSITRVRDGVSYAATTNKVGSFRVLLPPGVYVIKNGSTKTYPMISPIEVNITSGEEINIVVRGDSGIR